MATARGRSGVTRFIAQLPVDLQRKVLRGAARAAASVVADEAKDRAISHDVREAVTVKKAEASETGRITVKVTVKPGWGRSIGIWLEYGTAPHFISVDESQREGRSVNRINRLAKEGSLVINGHFVGTTVHHRGARAHPFLRPALDIKEGEAIAAAQSYINARVKPSGIAGPEDRDGGGE